MRVVKHILYQSESLRLHTTHIGAPTTRFGLAKIFAIISRHIWIALFFGCENPFGIFLSSRSILLMRLKLIFCSFLLYLLIFFIPDRKLVNRRRRLLAVISHKDRCYRHTLVRRSVIMPAPAQASRINASWVELSKLKTNKHRSQKNLVHYSSSPTY